jgi:hypothetical protein
MDFTFCMVPDRKAFKKNEITKLTAVVVDAQGKTAWAGAPSDQKFVVEALTQAVKVNPKLAPAIDFKKPFDVVALYEGLAKIDDPAAKAAMNIIIQTATRQMQEILEPQHVRENPETLDKLQQYHQLQKFFSFYKGLADVKKAEERYEVLAADKEVLARDQELKIHQEVTDKVSAIRKEFDTMPQETQEQRVAHNLAQFKKLIPVYQEFVDKNADNPSARMYQDLIKTYTDYIERMEKEAAQPKPEVKPEE